MKIGRMNCNKSNQLMQNSSLKLFGFLKKVNSEGFPVGEKQQIFWRTLLSPGVIREHLSSLLL